MQAMRMPESTPAYALRVSCEQLGKPSWTRELPIGDDIVLGRDPAASLCIDDELVSRRHVVVRARGGVLEIEDVSRNGTLVDGALLRSGARLAGTQAQVAIGCSKLVLQLVVPASAPAAHHAEVAAQPVHVVHDAPAATAAESTGERLLTTPVESAEPVPQDAEAAYNQLRLRIHRMLLEHLDMAAIDPHRREDPTLRPRVLAALRRIVQRLAADVPSHVSSDALVGEMADEALGLGPLEHLLADPAVSEIMVVDPYTIYVERAGKLSLSGRKFTDEERLRAAIERIVTPLGRRVDESSPLVDARLADGSRVNVVIRPLALRGSCVTIRKFARSPLTMEKLCSFGALSESMARFLARSVRAKKNVVIAGGTGSGKTTLLNVLSGAIPESERIVTIEDAAELQLTQPHVVSLESRPQNMEGKGEISIRDLVKNALRMRPDRIVVGECRGGEALDMLQAMNTGHDGSLTTTHANSPVEAIARLETLCLMAGLALPQAAIRQQIAKSVHLLVQQSRLSDGSRRVTAITEVVGVSRKGTLELRPIFEFVQSGLGEGGRILGSHRPTGYLPSYLHQMIVQGVIAPGEPYL